MTVEQEILLVYDSNPKAVFSIHQISKRTGKAYPYIHKKVNGLVDQGILKRTQMGRSHLCSLNLRNKQAVLMLSLNEIAKHENLPESVLEHARQLEQELNGNLACLVYDTQKKRLLAVIHRQQEHAHNSMLLSELKQRILEDEDFLANRIVIAGYEQFFMLLTHAEIERRYHPFL